MPQTDFPDWFISQDQAAAMLHDQPDHYVVIDVQKLPDDLNELTLALADQLARAEIAGKTPILWDSNPMSSVIARAHFRTNKGRR